jgi:DNA-binding MarR family transcriptional regulator
MTKLSDTQLVILSAASQREDGAVLPLTIDLKGGALQKVLTSLERKGLIARRGEPRGDDPPPLRITRAGLEAIGIEAEDHAEAPDPSAGEAPFVEVTDAPQGGTAAQEPSPADREAEGSEPAPEAAPAARTRAPRENTKQARMIELLKRPEGATVEQIAEATGWQKHTIRGAISGALKKRLGFTIEATRTREVGPNKVGARGSATVYRIVG